jgi:hypothetical protein
MPVRDHDTGQAFLIGGGLLRIGSGIQVGRAREQLSKAVWWYDRTLTLALGAANQRM